MQWRRDSVIIDPEPRSLVPPLTAGERAGLEESLKGEGRRDPLAVRRGPDGRQVLLDGRRRYEICGRLGISCRVAAAAVRDRDEARIWVVKNQISGRNLTGWRRVEPAPRIGQLWAIEALKNSLVRLSLDERGPVSATPTGCLPNWWAFRGRKWRWSAWSRPKAPWRS